MNIADPKQEHSNDYAEIANSDNSWEGHRLRQLGIDPDADPIEILMQLSDHFQKLYCTP
ncbi:MAG: hypothetical protein WBX22_28150 [Silvibacterium sp.]|jgi:hypothetical protein